MAIDLTTRSREPPIRANLATALVVIAAGLFLLLALPLLVRAQGLAWAWLALPAVLATVPHWALIHEAIHGHLLPERRANERLGRLLALLFLAPFDTLRFGHLSHHALNAKATERPEFYDPARCSRLRAALLYYPRLLGGLYLVEIASGPASFLPRRLLRPIVRRTFYAESEEAGAMADRAERVLLAPATLRRIRLEAAAILLLLALSFHLYGALWPLLLAVLAGRAFLVSFLDNMPHYAGPLDDPGQGFDLRAPRWLQRCILASNLHGTHHRHPNLPWPALEAAFRAEGGRFDGHYLLRPWRQLRGPLPLSQAERSR